LSTSIPLTVHKFGGAALEDAAAVRHAAGIVARAGAGRAVVVASAMRGVTDALLDVARRASTGTEGTDDGATAVIAALRRQHADAVSALGLDEGTRTALRGAIAQAFDELARMADGLRALRELTPATTDAVVARGERLSARLLAAALVAAGRPAQFVDALEVIHADHRHGNAAPDVDRTAAAAARVFGPLLAKGVVPVVPGFIARGSHGALVTLGRGGSDLTATVLGRVLKAQEVVLWKDVPGFLTADPRVVPDARLIPALDTREASELAYYGAKVLHPRALIALGSATRLAVRPLADPEAPGTQIAARARRRKPPAGRSNGRGPRTPLPVKAISAIAGQALVTITGNGMLGVPGVAARAFGALERAGISVSLISQASSEHSICIGIPAAAAEAAATQLRDAFAAELARREVDSVDVLADVTTIAAVGLGMAGTPGVSARLFGALAEAEVNVIAIAQGASELNISVVVDSAQAADAQRAIHAAFRLDKIGGGTADHARHVDVVLLGFGQIGQELAAQLANGRAPGKKAHAARLVGVIDRQGYVFDAGGLTPRKVAALRAAKKGGAALSDVAGGARASASEALERIGRHALSRPIVVDVTAGDTGALLEQAATHGMDVVLANKKPLAAPRARAERLMKTAAARGRRVLHEATVGAGLPVIDTYHKLVDAGDRVLEIQGCPSGTLGYLFGELSRGRAFSESLRDAMALGYTEPDPRDDLSGMDVARKALILGRLLGYRGELEDVRVESLVPEALRDVPLAEFLKRTGEMDAAWAERVGAARRRGSVLRYRATVTRRGVRVGVVEVKEGSSLASLSGTDNMFIFTTLRYRTNPLIITGPGAGAAVTAAGVLNDVLKLAGTR